MKRIKIMKSYVPLERKTNSVIQWQGYIIAKLRELRGLNKHKNNYGNM